MFLLQASFLLQVLSLLGPVALAAPAPEPQPTVALQQERARAPEPTSAPEVVQRGLGDDLSSYVHGLASHVESKISGFVESGILDYPTGFPVGSKVESSLGISTGTNAPAEPTQVLNVPPYANWTDQGWNVRVHGNVYIVPNVSQSKIDDLANDFLIGTEVKDLDATGQAQARNVTRSIFVIQQADKNVTVNFIPDTNVSSDAAGGAVNPQAGGQKIKLPYKTTIEGDFDTFVKLKNVTGESGLHLKPGNQTIQIQTLNVYTEGAPSGNATAYLVPDKGFTIVSDIDDILRVTKIYEPKQGLLNTFAKPFTPWMNMPDVYANWSAKIPDFHFHYLTTTPEQVTRNYMDFIYRTYPLGSFDTRPLNFSDLSATLSIRKFLLEKVLETFPRRKFILVADTSNSDVMKDYPEMYHQRPDQVMCILLRNTSATDDGDKFPYDTKGFKGIPQERYMFFRTPDDLTHLDIAGGQCYNATVKQNVTFDTQGLPFGLSGDGEGAGSVVMSSRGMMVLFAAMVVLFTSWMY